MSQDLGDLAALVVVAEKRSFTAAAAALGVTPSAVSQRIRAIEERVGVRLLQRTTRSVGLTEAGERFVARLRPALAEVDAAVDALGAMRDRPSGLLRLSVPRIGWSLVLEPILAEFLAENPDVRVEIRVDDALADIVADGFDAGLRLGERVERDMIAVRVTPDERVAIVGSPAYFAAHPRPRKPADLRAHACIVYRQMTRGEIYRWELTEDGRDLEIAVEGRVVTNDASVMLCAALDGLGLAYLLESTVRDRLADKTLVRVLDAYCPPFPGFFLYYPSRAQLAPKLAALSTFLVGRNRRARRMRKPSAP